MSARRLEARLETGGEEGMDASGRDAKAVVARLLREWREGEQVPGGQCVNRGGPYGHVRGEGGHDFPQTRVRFAKDTVALGEGGERLSLGFADLDGVLAEAELLPGGAVLGVEVALVALQGVADALYCRRGSGQVGGSLFQEEVR
ncbi:hypothetical protein ACGFYF_04895 [Streptomyces lavendulae]|uniref:hypothetical protein n=2 Tax=Streptomyces lavendulae TaxID=1914 RepID=UPI003713F02B